MYSLTLDGALHIGTGTGLWAIEMADQYPDAQVTGIDLSPIQPQMVPPNCVFEIDDATLDWTWDEGHFDFIHVREMLGCIGDWGAFLGEAKRCLKPGGWIEIVDHSTQPVGGLL